MGKETQRIPHVPDMEQGFLGGEVEMKIKASEQEGLTVDIGRALCSVRQTYSQRGEAEKKDALQGAERGGSSHPPPPTLLPAAPAIQSWGL